MNRAHLNHDYYTDIITFDLSDKKNLIEGDIYISLDRVRDNAKQNKVKIVNELNRVMAHGLLHLMGYKDKSKSQIAEMRMAENDALSMLNA
jgi:rRNA maturation RNase YbeY